MYTTNPRKARIGAFLQSAVNSYGGGKNISDSMAGYRNSAKKTLASTFRRYGGRPSKRARGPSKAVRGYNGITQQHDQATVYRKKTMPRYKKRKWRAFVKKVNAVHEKELGVARYLFNDKFDITNAAAQGNPGFGTVGLQNIYAAHLYGGTRGNGSITGFNTGTSDLLEIWAKAPVSTSYTGAPPPAGEFLNQQPGNTSKLKFISAILDMTVTADGSNTVPLEIDLYHIAYRKNWNNDLAAGTIGNSTYDEQMDQYVQFGRPMLDSAGAVDPQLRLRYRGTTPFEMSEALSAMGIKIIKKTKHFTPPGSTFTYQIRDPKSHIMDFYKFNSGSGGAYLKGLTQTVLLVVKPTYYSSLDTFGYHVGCTRTYKVSRDDVIEDSSILMGY